MLSIWIAIIIAVVIVGGIFYYAMIHKGTIKNDNELIQKGFSITRSAGVLRVDDKNKKWSINTGVGEIKIYDFSEMVDCKIEENSVLNKVNKLGVYIYTLNSGAIYIPLISNETKRDSFTYNGNRNLAQQICSMAESMKMQPVTSAVNASSANSVDNNTADYVEAQLKKYKSMVDSGIITQEDYEAKKKQLLGL